jgi:acetolactate synthase regulatory subunit
MCHLTIAIDQSSNPVARICNVIEESAFYIRSIRLVPTAWSRKADVHLSLAGGSSRDLNALLAELNKVPAVLAMHHIMPPV